MADDKGSSVCCCCYFADVNKLDTVMLANEGPVKYLSQAINFQSLLLVLVATSSYSLTYFTSPSSSSISLHAPPSSPLSPSCSWSFSPFTSPSFSFSSTFLLFSTSSPVSVLSISFTPHPTFPILVICLKLHPFYPQLLSLEPR